MAYDRAALPLPTGLFDGPVLLKLWMVQCIPGGLQPAILHTGPAPCSRTACGQLTQQQRGCSRAAAAKQHMNTDETRGGGGGAGGGGGVKEYAVFLF